MAEILSLDEIRAMDLSDIQNRLHQHADLTERYNLEVTFHRRTREEADANGAALLEARKRIKELEHEVTIIGREKREMNEYISSMEHKMQKQKETLEQERQRIQQEAQARVIQVEREKQEMQAHPAVQAAAKAKRIEDAKKAIAVGQAALQAEGVS